MNILALEKGLQQNFKRNFTVNLNKTVIIKSKNEGIITNLDVLWLEFLHQHTFLTEQQILRYIHLLTGKKMNSKRLSNMVTAQIINSFTFSTDDELSIEIYCLDVGGKHLLENYSSVDVVNWRTARNMKDSLLISKDLIIANFHLKLLETLGDRLIHFGTKPELKIDREKYIPSCEFTILDGLIEKNFLCQVFRKEDFPTNLRKDIETLSILVTTNFWKKYYFNVENPPFLFFLTDDDVTAKLVFDNMNAATTIDRYRVTTENRLKVNLGNPNAFLKYNSTENSIELSSLALFAYADSIQEK